MLWDPVHVKPCMHPPRVESLFLPVLWHSCTEVLLAFKAKCAKGCSFQCQMLGHLPGRYVIANIVKAPLLPFCCGIFFVLGCRIFFFFCSFQSILLIALQQLAIILVFFVRGCEHECFYSTILSLSRQCFQSMVLGKLDSLGDRKRCK